MREMLDCGVLLPPGHDAAMRGWIERHQPQVARVRFHPLLLASAGEAAEPQALAAMAVTLKRYDACLMPVEPATLAWTRIALQQARPALATPILVLVDGMKASAIEDLLALGAADFISEPVCLEGLRVRLRHQLLAAAWGLAAASLEEPALRYGAQGQAVLAPVGLPPHRPGAMPAPGRGREPGPEAGGSPPAATRPRVASALFDQAMASLRLLPRWQDGGEPFARAKARVVGEFEREYLRRALSHHGGNVAQAARASSKHRRAFWALMRKHGIEAAPYRIAAARRGQDMPSD